MAETDHYKTLGISSSATQAEIKRAYRALAKQFHPDTQGNQADRTQIIAINAAYEVLGDVQQRLAYDLGQDGSHIHQATVNRERRTQAVQNQYRQQRQANQGEEMQVSLWIKKVYTPINRLLNQILNPLKSEIKTLAADPFDDELMEGFQAYLEDCRTWQDKAQALFQSMPNPPQTANFAAQLYYCLNQVGDGIEELERFTTCYNEDYLHTGQEMFRMAKRLKKEIQEIAKQFR
jgi:molecular chaperone DnaJ